MLNQKPACVRNLALLALTLGTFFLLLGSRSLNEPDEGRYAVIAQAMLESGDWVVPRFWGLPHLDKPPFTYWAVAWSMRWFGQNEWAVRLPLALAGISGVLAVFLFGRRVAGERAGQWAAVILQTSLLYFVMARMLTTDVLLTQFIAWAAYWSWRGWCALRVPANQAPPAEGVAPPSASGGTRSFLVWTVGAWGMLALGFLTKGPVALAVPGVAVLALLACGRKHLRPWGWFLAGHVLGLVLFMLIVVPWFAAVFHRVPHAADFMIFGQAVGHALGTTITNRGGHPLYYFGLLATGFLPWTVLLGWLWRRWHWRALSVADKETWLYVSTWAIFPFVLFSFSRAKLPAYILPMFPALALLVAWRWFSERPLPQAKPTPPWLWTVAGLTPLAAMVVLPNTVRWVFRPPATGWLNALTLLAVILAVTTLGWRRLAPVSQRHAARSAAALAWLNLLLFALAAPSFETSLKGNQTLKPLGLALRQHYQPGDQLVCWERLPQGLPFYAFPALSVASRPYFGGMPTDKVPFEFPGNLDRFRPWLLADEAALARLMSGTNRVLLVTFRDALESFLARTPALRLVSRCGDWRLYAAPAETPRPR